MKPIEPLAAVLLVIGLGGCHQTLPSDNMNSLGVTSMDNKAREAAEVRSVEKRFAAAFNDRDLNAIMQLCVPDKGLVVFDVHPPRQVDGPRAYRKDWQEFFNLFAGPLKADVSEMDVTAGEDVAYVHYVHHVVGTMKSGKRADFTVRVTDCFKKVNGRWLIAHSHVSVPVDMQTGKADLESKP